MGNKFVYVDNAATTGISESVYRAMEPYVRCNYGNASSIYSIAREAKIAVEKSRQSIADALGAMSSEIYFTSGGTESDNWAILGYARAMKIRGKSHIITTNFEHHAVLHTCNALKKEGFDITYLPVDENGLISADDVEKSICKDTGLVTVMYANNEIGTILPIEEIGEICRNNHVVFHTDAVQALGNAPIDLSKQKIDMLSVSGHKIHSPKGIGLLYIRKGISPLQLMYGGGQERGKRPGTENVASIVALGQAIQDAVHNMDSKNKYLKKLQDQLIDGISKIPKVSLNGARNERLKGNVNFSFSGIEGESLLLKLDLKGICASSGSACTSGSLDPSHVLLAIGLDHGTAHGSLRLSLNEYNTQEDVNYILESLPPIVQELRDISPIWDN